MTDFTATMKALDAQSTRLNASSKLIQDGADFIPDLTNSPATAGVIVTSSQPAKIGKDWDEMSRAEQLYNSLEGGLHGLKKSWTANDAVKHATFAEQGLQSVYDIEESLDPESDDALRKILTGDNQANREFKAEATADLKEDVQKYRELQAQDVLYKQPEAMGRASQAAEGKGFWRGLGAAAGEFFSGDVVGNMIYLAGSSTGAMVPYIVAAAATGGIAGLSGIGALTNVARGLTMAYGSYQNEYGQFVLDELERRGVKPDQITAESFRDLLKGDYEQFARNRANRATFVSAFDFVSGYATGLRLNPSVSYRTLRNGLNGVMAHGAEGAGRAARMTPERSFMTSRGFVVPKAAAETAETAVDATRATEKAVADVAADGVAKTAGKNFASELENMASQATIQGALGGAGEYLGSKAAGLDPNMADVLMEALGEFTSAPVEVATTAVSSVTDARRQVLHAQVTKTFQETMAKANQAAEVVGMKIADTETVQAWASRVGEGKSFSAFAQDLVENKQVEEIRKENPELADQIEQAAAEGKSVDIPVSTIVSIATKDRKSADNIIMDCRPTVDGLSVRQAEDFAKNGRKKAEKQFDRTLKRFRVPENITKEANEIGTWLQSRLVEAKFSDDYAASCSAIWKSYLVQRAKLLGVSPKEVARMMNWGLDLGGRETTGKTGPMMPMAAEKRVEPATQSTGALVNTAPEERIPSEEDEAAGGVPLKDTFEQGVAEPDSALYQESFGENDKPYQETIEDFIGGDPSRKKAVDKLLDLMSTERQKDVVAESKGKAQIKYQKTINSKVLEAAKAAGVDLSDRESPITRALLVQTIVNDAVYATRVNSSAIGWYDEKVRKCLGYAGAMFPELDPANKEYDPNEAFRFLYVLATTSNGLKVKENLPLAVRIYKEYKRTGTLPAWGHGTQAEPMIKTIADFEKTKNTFDNIDQMRKFFMTTWTVKQLLTMGYNVAGESATESTRGAAIIGPKIGNGFFANLNGLFEALTMDRWFMRTFGRWTGTLIDFKPENFVQKVDAFREVLADVRENKEFCAWLKENGDFDVEEALRDTQPSAEIAITEMAIEGGASPIIRMIKRASQTFMPATFRKEYNKIWGGKDKPKSIGWRFYSAMKAVERAAVSDKVAPAGSTERRYIRSIFNEALDVLHGKPELRRLSMADLQAALWYAEKKIYENTKTEGDFVEDYDQKDAPDYANVMRDVALKNGVPQSKIDEITKRIDKEIKDENDSGKGPVRARYDTLTPKERVHVFGTRCFANLRSNRGVSVEDGAKQGKRGASVYRARREVGPSGVRTPERSERNPASGLDAGGTGRRGGQVPSVLTPIATWIPGNSVLNALRSYQEIKGRDVESAAPEFEEFAPTVAAAQTFATALKAAKKTMGPKGACVEEKSIEELTGQDEWKSQCRIFLSKDRLSGFVIKNGDDLVSVFSAKGSGEAIVEAAIAAGARRLDCFNTILPEYYARHGFRPVARLKFNREYAPYDWDYDFYAKYENGEPDIIFMVYDNSRQKSYDEYELEDLPYTDGEHYGEPYMSDAVAKYAEANKVVQESVDEANKEEAEKAATKPKKTKKAAPKTPAMPSLFDDSALFQDPVEQARLQALDDEYLSAVQSGNMDKAREMVEARAKEKGYGNAIPEQAGGWKVRTKPAPKETAKAYKVFFVDEQGHPTTLFVGDPQAVPLGVWVDAKEAFHITDARTGRRYVPTFSNPNRVGADGKKKTQKTGITIPIPDEATKAELVRRGFVGPKATTVTCVAYRPGWHAGTLPYFPQGGQKVVGSNYGMVHEARQVVFEIEVAAEKDYTDIARSQDKAKTKSGKVDARKADLDYLPKDGMYFYTTNPMLNPAEDGWVISDSIRIVRALSQEECDTLLAQAGKLPQEWAQGKLVLEDVGITDPNASDEAKKTLAPVTYDENGNVIPLSKRFDPNNDSVLYQNEDNRPRVRGQYNPVNTFNPTQGLAGVIRLAETADRSTFMHESAHAWLDADTMLGLKLAQKVRDGEKLTAGETSFLKNLGGFFEWGQREKVLDLGVVSDDPVSIAYALEQWVHMPVADQRGMHELFARGFESYLMNGESPSPEMTSLFQRFRSWLKDIYARARNAIKPISPEVKKLYDLMFVSEQEAADAESRAGLQAMFDETDRKKFMTDEESAQYEMLEEEANAETQSQISRAVSGPMGTFTRYSDKVRRQIMRQYKARVDEQEKILMQQPRYKAWHILRRGWTAEDGTVWRFKLSGDALKRGGYDKKTIKLLRHKRFVTDSRPGISLSKLARIVGSKSATELLGELLEVTSAKEEAADIIASQVQEETGHDIETYSRLKADLAAHNKVRSRLLNAEYNVLARMLGRRQLLVSAAREYAQKRLATVKVSELKPYSYELDERRCANEAEEAWRKGDYQRCLEMKRAQIVNHELARAALEIKDEQTKAIRRLKRGLKSESVHPANRQILAYVAYLHDLAPIPKQYKTLVKSGKLKRAALNAASDLLAEGIPVDGLSPDPETGFAQSPLLESNLRINDMTVDMARDLFSMLHQVEKLGRDRLTIEKNGIKEDARQEIAEGTQALALAAANQHRVRQEIQRTPTTKRAKLVDTLKQFFYAHIKIATWCRIFDRNKDGGYFWNHFIRSANERANWEESKRAEVAQRLQEILAVVTDDKTGIWDRDFVKIGGMMMSKGERIAAALNMGNESNLQRLRDGDPTQWTGEAIQELKESLSSAEWIMVQNIWDLFESLRPLIAEKQKRVYGVEPIWIDPKPFEVVPTDGAPTTVRGGYYPVVYDPRGSKRAEQLGAAAAAEQLMKGAFQSSTTNRSFTKQRSEQVLGRPLRLDLSALYSGLDDIIHDLAWHEWLINTQRLLNGVDGDGSGLSRQIKELYGYHVAKAFDEWTQAIAQGDRSNVESFARTAMKWLAGNIGLTAMGFSVSSAVSQITGIGYIIPRAGVMATLGAIRDAMSGRMALRAAINDRSDLMRTRFISANRQVSEVRNRLEKGKEGFIKKYAYTMMMGVQHAVDTICWQAQYRRCLDDGVSEEEAIARADQAVIDTQSSGRIVDESAVERSDLLGPFTVFYSWANAALNMEYAVAKGEENKAKRLATLTFYAFLMPQIDALLRDCLKAQGDDDDDDDDDAWWLKALIREPFANAAELHFGMFVGLREVSSTVKGVIAGEKVFDYAGPGGTRGVTVGGKGLQAIAEIGDTLWNDDKDFSWKSFNALIDVAGFAGAPTAQIKRTIKGVRAIESGQAEGFDALKAPIFGFEGPIAK